MTNDSSLFIQNKTNDTLPLYEAKMFFQYDHRYGTYDSNTDERLHMLPKTELHDYEDSYFTVKSSYYVSENEIIKRLENKWDYNWFLAFRGISSGQLERTFTASLIPFCGAGNSSILVNLIGGNSINSGLLLSIFNSIPFDYVTRQKASGANLNFFKVRQLPLPAPEKIKEKVKILFPKIIELVYSSWDIKAYPDDVWKEGDKELRDAIKKQWEDNKSVTGGHENTPPDWCEIDANGCPLPPFKWDEERRALLKAELDAIYAKLYGLTKDELRYILDPQDVYGPDFPGETFRVLKDKEIKKYGEYRTKRLVMEAWDRISENTTLPLQQSLTIDTMREFNLHEGIYSIKDTAEITGLSNEKIKRWFKELSNEQYEGLDTNQQTDVDNMRISFHGLIEIVVIGTLRDNNFSLKKILKARADLYEKTQKIYPFATNNVKEYLKVSGRDIVFQFADDTKVTLDGTGQINIDFITQFFRDIIFDVDGVAQRIMPEKGKGKVVVDPKEGGGKPSIVGKEVWVELINSFYTGPDSIEMIQEQYNLDKDEILAAVEFSQ